MVLALGDVAVGLNHHRAVVVGHAVTGLDRRTEMAALEQPPSNQLVFYQPLLLQQLPALIVVAHARTLGLVLEQQMDIGTQLRLPLKALVQLCGQPLQVVCIVHVDVHAYAHADVCRQQMADVRHHLLVGIHPLIDIGLHAVVGLLRTVDGDLYLLQVRC